MKMSYNIKLGDVSKFIRGITFKPEDKVALGSDDAVVCMRTKNVQAELDETDLIAVPSVFVRRKEQYLKDGDILISTANSWELVGKCSWIENLKFKSTAGGFISILRGNQNKINSRYLYHWLASPPIQHALRHCGRQTTNISNLSFEQANSIIIPIPYADNPEKSLAEQRRIAAILDQADAIRKKRQQAINELNNLIPAIFAKCFGKYIDDKSCYVDLANVSEIVSGVTKGRKFNGKKTIILPYLRVANVQDGYLELSEIKEIEALPEDLEKYRLEYGDILLTEGGDFDKLGRGTMWEGQIENCIHQNHVFRVRVNHEILLPEYFDSFLQTQAAKYYFLRCAKKTSNLASINMTQLRKLPIPIPDMNIQKKYADSYHKHNEMSKFLGRTYLETDALFMSLVQQVFKGNL